MSTDTAARHAVEGVPCYMYGIRAPEDELPVAEQPATEVPEDIMQAATDWLSGRRLAFYEESGPKTLIETVARAILAERKRCADIAKLARNDAEFYGNPEMRRAASLIAHRIESGQ